MSHIQTVAKARARKDGRAPYRCYDCGKDIEVGQSYRWFSANRFSPRISWHSGCKEPRPSKLESNDKRARAMEAFEDAYDALQGLQSFDPDTIVQDCENVLSDCAEGLREAAEMATESASNIEEGFGHSTEKSDELNEWAEMYENAASTCEDLSTEEMPERDPELDDDDWEATLEEWVSSVISAAEDTLNNAEGETP